MSTPEKPRPTLDDTIARIDQALAEPISRPPCFACPREALPGSFFCAVHRRLPCEVKPIAAEPAPPDPDWVTFEKPRHLPGPPSPTCPGCQADAARPGWLDRLLRRLFG